MMIVPIILFVVSWLCKVSALLTVSTKLRQPTGQRQSNVRRQQKNQSDQSYSYMYYEKSLVSSNLNSKLLWFHSVRPNVQWSCLLEKENSRCYVAPFLIQMFVFHLTLNNKLLFFFKWSTMGKMEKKVFCTILVGFTFSYFVYRRRTKWLLLVL